MILEQYLHCHNTIRWVPNGDTDAYHCQCTSTNYNIRTCQESTIGSTCDNLVVKGNEDQYPTLINIQKCTTSTIYNKIIQSMHLFKDVYIYIFYFKLDIYLNNDLDVNSKSPITVVWLQSTLCSYRTSINDQSGSQSVSQCIIIMFTVLVHDKHRNQT